MFSGGTYGEVARWLGMFLTSHAKREHPRIEVVLEAGDERAGKSYGVRLRFGARSSAPLDLRFDEVAGNRGSLTWCRAMAERTRAIARELVAAAGEPGAASRIPGSGH